MSVLSKAVAAVDKATKALGMQVKVTQHRALSDGGTGTPTVKIIKGIEAVVAYKQQMLKGPDGELIPSKASVTFLVPRVVNPGDTLVLPDGSANRVLSTSGPVDVTGQLITEAFL